MGDRGNVYVHDGLQPGVYLYTHWSGSQLPSTVHKALSRGERWGDAQYLARIVFEEMIREDFGSTTGYGISAVPVDGEDQLVDVNTGMLEVTLTSRGSARIVSFNNYLLEEEPTW